MRDRHLSRRLLPAVALSLALALGACATSGGSGDGASGPRDRITQAELSDLQQVDAYQAVQRLRPEWLRRRGGETPRVVVDGIAAQDGVQALRRFRASEIRELRFLDASDATMRFGTGYTAGAIVVTTGR